MTFDTSIGDARRKSFFFARILKNEVIEGPTLLSEVELKAKLESLDLAYTQVSDPGVAKM